MIPLHIYLKKRGLIIRNWLKQTINFALYSETVEFDFSESLHKLKQEILNYLKTFDIRIENLSKI
jgi:hypothetical protein